MHQFHSFIVFNAEVMGSRPHPHAAHVVSHDSDRLVFDERQKAKACISKPSEFQQVDVQGSFLGDYLPLYEH